jgi:hypothetical protein
VYHVERELATVRAGRDLVRGGHDRRCRLGRQLPRFEVRAGGRGLDVGERRNQLELVLHRHAGVREVRERANGVGAVEGVRRDRDGAERVSLVARRGRLAHV